MINLLRKTGAVSFPLLREELEAAFGPAGDPPRWWLSSGQEGAVTVFFVDTIDSAAVQAVLDAHDPSAARVQDFNARRAFDAVDRLQFAALFDLENRVRALEAKPAVTQAQYRAALIARWKALNP